MSSSISQPFAAINTGEPLRRGTLVTALGFIQIISWGSSYYLLAVLAKPIVADSGWSLPWVVGGIKPATFRTSIKLPLPDSLS